MDEIAKYLARLEETLLDAMGHVRNAQSANAAPNISIVPIPTENITQPTMTAAIASSQNIDILIPGWTNPIDNRHNVRVLCDLSGLDLNSKNVITACVEQESGFYNYLPNGDPVEHRNMSGDVLESTDWGIIQCNDKNHIGVGKDFASVGFVMANPQVMVQWMIDMYKVGRISMWDSYSTGAYKRFMPKN